MAFRNLPLIKSGVVMEMRNLKFEKIKSLLLLRLSISNLLENSRISPHSVLILCNLVIAIFLGELSSAYPGIQIRDVQRRFEEIKTFSSSFTQVTYSSSDDEVGSASGGSRLSNEFKGKIIAERPNKFQMEVREPEKQILLSDGNTLWIYLPEENQAIKMNPEEGLTFPVEIFFNPFQVYNVEWLPTAKKEKPILEVRPKEEGSLFEKAWVQIHSRSLLVKEIQLFDFDGNRIHYIFSNVKVNQKLKSTTFHFDPPRGVEVVER